jgi:hypothetical protein
MADSETPRKMPVTALVRTLHDRLVVSREKRP